MTALSEILDREAMERMVTGFREGELEPGPDWRIEDGPQRDVRAIRWTLATDITTDGVVPPVHLLFDGKEAVRIAFDFEAREGDIITLNYTLSWFWYGRGDDGEPMVSPRPRPGFAIEFTPVLCA